MLEQARNVCRTTVVSDAWQRGQNITVHGWVYGLSDGRARDLGMRASSEAESIEIYHEVMQKLRGA